MMARNQPGHKKKGFAGRPTEEAQPGSLLARCIQYTEVGQVDQEPEGFFMGKKWKKDTGLS